MKKIKIKRNTNGDSRSATTIPTINAFGDANSMHVGDVEKMMKSFAEEIKNRSTDHDWSKLYEPHRSMFYRDLCNTIEGRMNFEEGEWYKFHCDNERHHLLKRCPDDVNLIDVLEMICDCVCAGMARTGSVYPIEISSEILQRALSNTVEMCMNAVEVEEGKQSERLIDANKLLRDIEHYNLSDGKFQHWVEIQPTIEPEHKKKKQICVCNGYSVSQSDWRGYFDTKKKTV